jgi:hypothetical protein
LWLSEQQPTHNWVGQHKALAAVAASVSLLIVLSIVGPIARPQDQAAGPPLRHRLPTHPELLGHPGLWPASRHALHQQLAGMNSQTGISVLHEDLLAVVLASSTTTSAGGPPFDQAATPSATVNNVLGRNN